MPRLLTMAELEAELLGGSEQLRDVLLLGCCEMMDSVVREFGSRELPAWRRAVETARGAMWESVAGDRRLGAFGEQTLALCHQSGFHLNEHASSRFVASYGVAAHEVVCVLDRATAARQPADDASRVFTAMQSLSAIFLPDKTVWKSEDFDAFRRHVSQLALRQGLAALIERFASTGGDVIAVKQDARAIGHAFLNALPPVG